MGEKVNYVIKKITLNKANIESGWVSVVFYEDIYSNEMSGYIEIMESETFREGFEGLQDGIIGEETLKLIFCSRFPNGTEQEDIEVEFSLNKLDKWQQNTLEQKVYKLHFVSKYHDANVGHRSRKYWEGTSDDIIKRIVEKQLGGSLVRTDPAKFNNEIIFPNLMPYQVANFLSDISMSNKYNDPKYLFYECRDGFNFVTMSYLMDQPISHMMSAEIFAHGSGDLNRFNIQSYASNSLFDSLMNETTGMFGNTYIQYDKIDKKYYETVNTYPDTWDQFKHVGETPLVKNLKVSGKNRFQFMIAGKPENPNTYIHTDEWSGQLLNRSNQSKNNTFVVTYTGNTNLKIGRTIDFGIMSTKNRGMDQDRNLSGKFLITRIKHVINRNNYITMLEIVKDGYRSGKLQEIE